MGTCWCKIKSRPISEPYLPATPEPQIVSVPTTTMDEAAAFPPITPPTTPPPDDEAASALPPAVPESKRERIEIKMIDQLVLEMLGSIACYVDKVFLSHYDMFVSNEMPPALMHLHMIADREDGWIAVISSVINVTPLENPFGPSLITVLLDDCPLPCKDTVIKLTRLFRLSSERVTTGECEVRIEANMCAVLGCIAERLAGPNCVAILTDNTLEYLVAFLACARDPNLMLYALFTLEKFALTSDNKVRIKQKLGDGSNHLLLQLEKHINDKENIWCQVGFCAQWALDNIFVIEGRKLGYETVDMTGINAILNSQDTSEYLKISSDGLMARCDSYSFESVRCTFQVDEGCWFYECTIMTRGVMQIGWATKNSHFLNYEGYGVGDDLYSVSYDGCRKLIWYKAGSNMVMDAVGWKPGDVLGCILDLLEKEVVFLLNGVPLAIHTEIFNATRSGFFAAASFMTYQQCRFNFGNEPFKFPPTDREFLCFNDFAQLDEEEKKIIPRRLVNAQLQEVEVDENTCTLCCDARACCILMPCKHQGFCSICTSQLKDCPMCRAAILHVAIVELIPDEEVPAPAAPVELPPATSSEEQWVNDLDVIVTR